jgi:hypothetical protein
MGPEFCPKAHLMLHERGYLFLDAQGPQPAQIGHLHAGLILLEIESYVVFGELALAHGYSVLKVALGRSK